MQRRSVSRPLITAMLLVAVLSLLAATPPELPNPGSASSMTKEEQQQLGLQVMGEVYKQMPVLPDSSPETQYVQQLGRKLVATIPAQYSWPFQFHVIPQKEINAFALPGGPMFVNVGAIAAADNEAQLAGVMAHEIAHVYMQHSAKQASKQALTQNIVGMLGGFLGGGTVGSLAQMGMQMGAGIISMKYSRSDEAQADAIGSIIIYKVGYDPTALGAFFKKIEGEGGQGPQFLSDHPNPGNRTAAIQKQVAEWPPREFQNNSEEFLRAKEQGSSRKLYTAEEIAQGAKQGLWARQNAESVASPAGLAGPGGAPPSQSASVAGITFEQIRPSTNFKPLEHSAFTISYPDNWQAFGDATSNVTIGPAAAVSEQAIAYGVVIGAAQSQNASLGDATSNLIRSLQKSNPDLRVSGTVQQIEVGRVAGLAVNLTGPSPVQQNGAPLPERDWLVTLPRGGGLVYFIFIAPETTYGELNPTYQKMLQTVQLR